MKIKFFGRIAAVVVAVVIIASSVSAQSNVKQSKDEQMLTALVKRMTEAQSKFDPTTLEKIYASDYIEVSPIGEVDPREKAIGFYKPQPDMPANAAPIVTTDEFQIRSYKDFALVIAKFTFTAQAGSEMAKRPPVSFRATVACRKEKGAWKIASVQATGIRPPLSPQAK